METRVRCIIIILYPCSEVPGEFRGKFAGMMLSVWGYMSQVWGGMHNMAGDNWTSHNVVSTPNAGPVCPSCTEGMVNRCEQCPSNPIWYILYNIHSYPCGVGILYAGQVISHKHILYYACTLRANKSCQG